MKSASLRVEPELRKAAEAVLQDGESLSAFIESSLRSSIEWRLNQKAFIGRGLAARDRARQSNSYGDGENVIGELRGMLEKAGKRSA
jgi:predicted transcriptional regulator